MQAQICPGKNLIATFNAQGTPNYSCSRAQTYSHSTDSKVNIIKLKQEITQKKKLYFQNH